MLARHGSGGAASPSPDAPSPARRGKAHRRAPPGGRPRKKKKKKKKKKKMMMMMMMEWKAVPGYAKRAAPSRRTARFADRLNPGTARRSP